MSTPLRLSRCAAAGLMAAFTLSALPSAELAAQATYQCAGDIGGVQSTALLQIEPGGGQTGQGGGPYVAGQIQNATTAYSFTGELFGGTEGYMTLVDAQTGERIERVWIGLGQSGFSFMPEGGPRYDFACQQ